MFSFPSYLRIFILLVSVARWKIAFWVKRYQARASLKFPCCERDSAFFHIICLFFLLKYVQCYYQREERRRLLTTSDASLASLLKDCDRIPLRMSVVFSKTFKKPKDVHESEVSILIKTTNVCSSQRSSRGSEPIP